MKKWNAIVISVLFAVGFGAQAQDTGTESTTEQSTINEGSTGYGMPGEDTGMTEGQDMGQEMGQTEMESMPTSQASMDPSLEDASRELGAEAVAEVAFEQGSSDLTENTKTEIRDFVQQAKAQGNVEDIKIAVWADREYPGKDTKASKEDVDLASERGKRLKDFIEDELEVSSVDTYNMTERPNALQQFLRTPEAKVKQTLEARGGGAAGEQETGLFGEGSRSSSAVIMVYQ